MRQKHFYEFGAFRIEVALNRLERAGQAIPLPPKAFDLLVLLARNTDRVMSKTELMEALWPNTFVEEANLTQHIYTLRKALGDRTDGQPYIDTVPRRGYRLAVVVKEGFEAHDTAAAAATIGQAPSEARAAVAGRSIAVEGERKHATVLDCRIANAAAVVERLGPAATQSLTRDLLNAASEEIEKYEGLTNERHADGFVALFGAPVVHEDDGRRAVLAALAIQRRFRGMVPADVEADEPLDLRIGVSTGPLVVTRSGTDREIEYSAVGDAARVAGLLQQLAEPGTLLISDATRRAAEGYVEIVPASVEVAGAPAFRVVGPLSAGGRRPAHRARSLAPFVGRLHQVAALDALAAHVRAGKGQAISIVGEPGIGKSRLLYECAQQVGIPSGMTLLEGRCVSYGSLVPYLPLVELIRTHCGVGEGDSPEAMRLAIDRSVRGHDLPSDAGTWLLRLLGMIDASSAAEALSPEAIKARTFDALRTLFFKASRRTPLLIAIEDIHWIDRTSEEFLTTLVERLAGSSIMMITTCRPGYRVPWLDRSYLTQISLTPLAPSDGAQLVGAVSREQPFPEAVATAIVEKGEGNPFFLEELARTVVERGPDSHSIPDTVQGVIMARVDRLPDTAKRVLQTASVLGREMPLQLLNRVWGGGDCTDELAQLCRLEFLYERAGTDEPVLVFKHALTQDVAYDSLLARNRRELHLRAAKALLAIHGNTRDDLAATFAYHYARTDLIDEAVDWLTRAADQAARVYANAEAILHLDLAMRKLQRVPEGTDRDRRMLDVALRHAHSLYFLGQFRASVDVLLPHEVRLSRLHDPVLTAAYSFWLAHMQSRLGDQRRASESALRAIEAATRASDQDTLGKAHGVLALEGHWSGNTADGLSHGEEAVRLLSDRRPQRWWLGMAHFYVAMNHLLAGNFESALAAAERADSVGKEIGDPRLQTYAGFTSGWVEATRGNSDIAIALCRRSRDQAPDRVSRAYASMVLGYALIESGEHDQARMLLEPIVAELEGFGFPQWHGFAATLLAEACRRERELERPSAFIERALEVTTRSQYQYGIGFAQRVAARIARDHGAMDDAGAGLERAASTFERIGAAFEAARTRTEASDMEKAARAAE